MAAEATGFSKSERYMAFLMANLPRLQTVALYPPAHDPAHIKRIDVLAFAMQQVRERPGLCLEFGVHKGGSIRYCGRTLPDRQFHGFDSFEGFPDDGRPDWKSDFSVPHLPEVPANCHLVQGWFSQTLPKFLEEHSGPVAFVNIDCDIYSSTAEVFAILEQHGRLRPGLFFFFDELINYHGYLWNEAFALFEMLERTGFGLDWMCMHQKVRPVEEHLDIFRQGKRPGWTDDINKGFRQQACLVLNDRGIDYGPLDLPHYARRVRDVARIFEDQTISRFKGDIDFLGLDIDQSLVGKLQRWSRKITQR